MTTTPQHETCLIVDFGSQVTQLIARRLREMDVYCEIHPFNLIDDALIARLAPKAVILSGGPASVEDEGSPRAHPKLFELGVPVLGHIHHGAGDPLGRDRRAPVQASSFPLPVRCWRSRPGSGPA